MNAQSIERFKGAPAVGTFVILVLAALLLWWTNTVLAMLLVFAAMFVFSFNICSISVEPVGGIPRREHHRFGQWKFFPLEELEALEEELAEMLESEKEEGGFSVPVEDMDKSESLPHKLPLAILDGIDDSCTRSLADRGISDLVLLADADPDQVALICQTSETTATKWINEARGIVKGAGITSILELAMSRPGEVLVRINEALEEGRIENSGKGEFSERAIRGWIRAAKKAVMLSPDDIKKWRDRRQNL